MSSDTMLGMLMALGILMVLIIALVVDTRRKKRMRLKNMPDFMNNAKANSEAIHPEVKDYALALVMSNEGIYAAQKDAMKTIGKGIVKGTARGNVRARDMHMKQGSGMHYVVRYQADDMYFFPIGMTFSCQYLQMDANYVRHYSLHEIRKIKTNINMIEIIDDECSFAFQIMISQQTHHLHLKEEAKAFRTYLGNLKKKLSA